MWITCFIYLNSKGWILYKQVESIMVLNSLILDNFFKFKIQSDFHKLLLIFKHSYPQVLFN